MRLADPPWLILLCLLPLFWWAPRRRWALPWPVVSTLPRPARSTRIWPAPIVRSIAWTCLVIGLARPQVAGGTTPIRAEGIAILCALDHSSSMSSADFPGPSGSRTRLEAAKQTLARFLLARNDDLLGLLLFANLPDLACPPTLDHESLLEEVQRVRVAGPSEDGTNLGDAIAWGLGSLQGVRATRKVVILLTDGRNQPGVPRPLDPLEAAGLARSLGVVIHTIALGPIGGETRAVEPLTGLVVTRSLEGPDTALLRALAERTGGQSFHAAQPDVLDQVFRQIDSLERSRFQAEVAVRYRDRFAPWLVVAGLAVLVDQILMITRFRRLP